MLREINEASVAQEEWVRKKMGSKNNGAYCQRPSGHGNGLTLTPEQIGTQNKVLSRGVTSLALQIYGIIRLLEEKEWKQESILTIQGRNRRGSKV